MNNIPNDLVRFDKDEFEKIFNTVMLRVASTPMPEESKPYLLFNSMDSILGVTLNLYRFHKELEHYNEEE